jgi:very-short-patch-repair endonuclease
VPLPAEVTADERIHVAIPNPRRAPRGAGVVGHKFVVHPAAGEVVEVRGIRLSSAPRAWCELGRLLDRDALVVAGDHIARPSNGFGGATSLLRTLDRHPDPRARRRLEEAAALIDPRAESPGETRMRLVLLDAGIRGFVVNQRVAMPGSTRHRRVDLAFPDQRIAFEYQGDHHRDPRQWREDMSRVADLESVGWSVTFVNADDLRHPEALAARARRLLSRAPRREGA